jgi:tetratricopeptide (TPR) repeat protein
MDTHQARAARLRDFLARDPLNQDLACAVADAYIASGDVAAAKAVLDSLAQSTTPSPGVRFRLARCALMTGDYAGSVEACRSMIDDGLDGIALRHDLAFAQLCMQQPQDAMSTLERALADFGATPELHVLKSRVEAMLGDFDAAVASADAALALRPGDPSALGVKALSLLDGDRLDDAALAAQEALAIDPDQHEALLVASTLSLWQQQLDPAQGFFERALTRHPNSGRALSGYGQVMMLRNDLPRAGEILERAVRAMPNHIGTWHALAWTQLLQERPDDAETSYRNAYDVDRNFGDTHGGLALVAALRGQYDEAEQSIKRALRLDPEAVTARYAQALLMEARGDIEGSEAQITKLLPQSPLFTSVPVGEFARRLKSTLAPGSR